MELLVTDPGHLSERLSPNPCALSCLGCLESPKPALSAFGIQCEHLPSIFNVPIQGRGRGLQGAWGGVQGQGLNLKRLWGCREEGTWVGDGDSEELTKETAKESGWGDPETGLSRVHVLQAGLCHDDYLQGSLR